MRVLDTLYSQKHNIFYRQIYVSLKIYDNALWKINKWSIGAYTLQYTNFDI